MKPYGVKLSDRRPMYDYMPDKYNTRGCFNACNCHFCKQDKTVSRKNTVRSKKGIYVINAMRSAKKKERRNNKIKI
jgi:hypothetical protein